ncbi:MAG: hypothetical protein ABR555_05270 [Pyrinomonadaceae bacterium]
MIKFGEPVPPAGLITATQSNIRDSWGKYELLVKTLPVPDVPPIPTAVSAIEFNWSMRQGRLFRLLLKS